MEEVSTAQTGIAQSPQTAPQEQPKGTTPIVAQVDSPTFDDESPDRSPPDPIDWDEIDDRIQDFISDFENMMRMLGLMSWDDFVSWLRTNFGVNIRTQSEFIFRMRNFFGQRLGEWYNQNYPNSTQEQNSTFDEHYRRMDDRLQQLWDEYTSVPGVPSPYTPLGGMEDDRYRPMDLNDPSTWENFDPYDPFRYPWWAPPPHNQDDPRKPYPGTYQT